MAEVILPCDTIDEVNEGGPWDFQKLYDGLGLPRHWESPLPV